MRLSTVRIFVIGLLLAAKFPKKRQRVGHLFCDPVNGFAGAQCADANNEVAPRFERLKVGYYDTGNKADTDRCYERSCPGLEIIARHKQHTGKGAEQGNSGRVNNFVEVLEKFGHRVEVRRKLILDRRWQETNGTSLIW